MCILHSLHVEQKLFVQTALKSIKYADRRLNNLALDVIINKEFGKYRKGISRILMVPKVGIEPTRYCYRRILNPLRLPIPSLRQRG